MKYGRILAFSTALLLTASPLQLVHGAENCLDETSSDYYAAPISIYDSIQENDALFEEYVRSLFYESGESEFRLKPADASDVLTGANAALYEKLRDAILEVASGEQTSTRFAVPIADLGLSKTSWTAQELGLNTLVDENNRATQEAMMAAVSQLNLDLDLVHYALLADYPYELYWFDKVEGSSPLFNSIKTKNDGSGWIIEITGDIIVPFSVAQGYASADYTVDPSAVTAAKAAAEKAGNIVAKYAGKTDLEKLLGYKDEICSLVSYNFDAAQNDVDFGDPWQLVWVFDENTDTNVVCEGYSKAFKYLCDCSSFANEISCILVTGTMISDTVQEEHMWNIVTMDDGNNYLVDVTSCDDGAAGNPDLLFLKGYVSGNEAQSYTFDCDSTNLTYVYDSTTLDLFDASKLTLCGNDYEEAPEEPHTHEWDKGTITTRATCTKDGVKTYSCSGCEETRTEKIKATGHTVVKDAAVAATCTKTGLTAGKHCSVCNTVLEAQKKTSALGHKWDEGAVTKQATYTTKGEKTYTCSRCKTTKTESIAFKEGFAKTNGKTYYYLGGKAIKGQKKIDNYWYLFNKSTGEMQTGFVKIPEQNKTVYYDANGRMVYGQKKIDGYWYNFKQGSGAMQTGFVKIPAQNKTVYYDANGRMVYGQKKINGYWYNFKQGSGTMQTGFVKIPSQNKTVYYDKNGRMLYGRQVINGKVYNFHKSNGALL